MSVPCGIYFTSSPGYSVYGSDTSSTQPDDNRRRNLSLHRFWGEDVDDRRFFTRPLVQQRFAQVLDAICKCAKLQGEWTLMFGEGPYGEAGGLAGVVLQGDLAWNLHRIAHCLGYFLQQVTLYYYIDDFCFVSRCNGEWSDVRSERPRPKDWTTDAALEDLGDVASLVALAWARCLNMRKTVMYQPRAGQVALRSLDDPECVKWHRISLVVELELDRVIDIELEWTNLVQAVRERLPTLLWSSSSEPVPTSLLAWTSADGWSDAVYILASPTGASLICRREVHPWYDVHAEQVISLACRIPFGQAPCRDKDASDA